MTKSDRVSTCFSCVYPLTMVCALLVLGSGCDWIGGHGEGDNDGKEAPPPRSLTTTEKTVVDTDNRFGLKLLRAAMDADDNPENVFVSPISVSMALGMTLNGAQGETRAAMEQVLEKQDLSSAEINDAYRGLIDLLEGLDPNVDVALANSIWYDETLPVRQAFIDTNRAHFDAEAAGLDFGTPEASERINDWVDAETQGNISEIVQDRIPNDILMYLINATYFKGPWRAPFDPAETEDETFHLADGSTATVPMMERREEVMHP